jgi:hypothetical protein
MRNLRNRLEHLETQFGDGGSLGFRTKDWVGHWVQRLLRIERGEEMAEPGSMPLAAYRAIVALADQNEVPPGRF